MDKLLVFFAALVLHDRLLLDYDEPISKYLTAWDDRTVVVKRGKRAVPAKRPILVKDLCGHLSGLGSEHFQQAKGTTTEEKLKNGSMTVLLNEPGESAAYRATPEFIRLIIEAVTGQRMPDAMKALVFEPLEMSRTSYVTDFAQCAPKFFIKRPRKFRMILKKAGGLVGTPCDYLRAVACVANGGQFEHRRIISQASMDKAQENVMPQDPSFPHRYQVLANRYGSMGYLCAATALSGVVHGKGTITWGGGWGTSFFIDPVKRYGIVTWTHVFPYVSAPSSRRLVTGEIISCISPKIRQHWNAEQFSNIPAHTIETDVLFRKTRPIDVYATLTPLTKS